MTAWWRPGDVARCVAQYVAADSATRPPRGWGPAAVGAGPGCGEGVWCRDRVREPGEEMTALVLVLVSLYRVS